MSSIATLERRYITHLEYQMPDLNILYEDVDQNCSRLVNLHGNRLKCQRGCSACCLDDITVFEVEADNIRKKHSDLLETGTPHATGACAFLDSEGACRIYADRPYVCRTQGLPLRWLEETEDGEFIELRDICELNDEGEPIEELFEDECWTIGPAEEQLNVIQHEFSQGSMTRVKLRSLFKMPADT